MLFAVWILILDRDDDDRPLARALGAGAVGVRQILAPDLDVVAVHAGATVSRGERLLFVHADSRLPQRAHASLAASPARGGNFALRFDGGDRFSRVLGTVYAVQRRAGFYYGDSSVWARRDAFDELGGFRELAIMDDYDFVRRLERGGDTACLPGPALTSARRWRRHGIPRTVFSWVVIRWLFVAGVAPKRLARLYQRVR